MDDEIKIPKLCLTAGEVSRGIVRFYAHHFTQPPDLGIFRQIEVCGKHYLKQLFLGALQNPVENVDKEGVIAKFEVTIESQTDLYQVAGYMSDALFGFEFSTLKVREMVTPRNTTLTIYFY